MGIRAARLCGELRLAVSRECMGKPKMYEQGGNKGLGKETWSEWTWRWCYLFMIHMSRPAAGNHSKELLTYPPLKSAKGGFTEGKIIIPQDTGACMGAGGGRGGELAWSGFTA